MTISVNGQFVKTIELTGDEPEFNYAYGVFETIRTYHGKPFQLTEHLQRLRRSAESISLEIAATNEQLTQWLKQHCTGESELRIKVIAALDKIYIVSKPLIIPPILYAKGVAVGLYTLQRTQPEVKSLARIQEYLAYQQALSRKQHDALLINERKELYECAQGNFFYVKENTIFTPRSHILAGITRGIVIALAEPHYHIKQQRIYLDEVLNADECFMTQTTTGVVPVVQIDQRKVKTGKPGLVTQHIMELFRGYTDR